MHSRRSILTAPFAVLAAGVVKRVHDWWLDLRIRQASLSNKQLLKMAKTHHPPQSWYDDDTNPFVAETTGTFNSNAPHQHGHEFVYGPTRRLDENGVWHETKPNG